MSGTKSTPYSDSAIPSDTTDNISNDTFTNNVNYGQFIDSNLLSGTDQIDSTLLSGADQISNLIPNSMVSNNIYGPFQRCLDQRQLTAQASGILPPGVTCGGSQSISYPGSMEQFAMICDQFIADCNSLRPQIDQDNAKKIDCFTLDGDMCTQLQTCMNQGKGPPNFDPRPKCTTNPRGLFSSDCSNVTVVHGGVCKTYPISPFQRCMYRGEKYMQKISMKLPSNVDCGSMDNTQVNKTLAAVVCDEIIDTCLKNNNKYMEVLTVN